MSKRTNLRTWLAKTSILLAMGCTALGGRIVYVDIDANGVNDGSSWTNAYKYLQDALADAILAEKPVEVWVAQGTYKPDQGAGITPGDHRNRHVSFQLINEVTINGGYAGLDEPDPNARDIELFQTILSGDLNGDDINVKEPCDLLEEPSRFDNSRNVVTGSNTDATAVLDGFTITGGHTWAIPFGSSPAGGTGMFISSGSPTLIDCTFTDNATNSNGGGLLIYDDSNPKLLNCKFTRNYAGGGGGICNTGSSSPTIINCTFSDNYVQYKGGGIFNVGGNPTLTNCTFNRNLTFQSLYGSDTKGGGMYNVNSSPVLTNCAFSENTSDHGGAVYNDKGTNSILIGCTFLDNLADHYGGAIFNHYIDSSSMLIQCVFNKNSALQGGAMEIYCHTLLTDCIFTGNFAVNGGAIRTASTTFENCIFTGNRALGYDSSNGGAVHIIGGAPFDTTVKFNNCTFSNNWANFGCAIFNSYMAYVNNCIFWGSEDQIHVNDPYGILMFVDYSDVQGGWFGEGNIDADPCFTDPGHWADANDPNVAAEPNDPNAVWIDGDYHIKSQAGRWNPTNQIWIQDDITSPCIDAGDPNSPIDLEPFPNGGIINMGAYGGSSQAGKSYFGEPVCETIIAGDINGDCKVDFMDFTLIAAHWLEDNNP